VTPKPIKFARRVDVGSSCVYKRPTPKTDALVLGIFFGVYQPTVSKLYYTMWVNRKAAMPLSLNAP